MNQVINNTFDVRSHVLPINILMIPRHTESMSMNGVNCSQMKGSARSPIPKRMEARMICPPTSPPWKPSVIMT